MKYIYETHKTSISIELKVYISCEITILTVSGLWKVKDVCHNSIATVKI